MHIQGNKIVYTNHKVILNISPGWSTEFVNGYLQDMCKELTANGTAEYHRKELYGMNNDGSWSVRKIAIK